MTFTQYKSDACKHGYKPMIILNRDMARWISTLDVVKRTDGIWVDQESRADDDATSDPRQAKYLNLKLELRSNKRISSIMHTNPERRLFGVCVAEKYWKLDEDNDSNSTAKYFLTENFYQPSSINGYFNNNSDTFKEMDAMCKSLNKNSMLATTIPPGTRIAGMEPNSLVYVGVRASVKGLFEKAQQDCSHKISVFSQHFDALVHPVGGKVNITGLNGTYFKVGYPHIPCSDVPKTAVAYDGKNLINIIPIARLRIACVTCRVEGLNKVDKCGKGGDYNPTIGECVCKDNWIDITNMTHLPQAKNYQKGMVCVPKTPCSMEGQKNYIVFVLDASDATHRDTSFKGLKQFVEMGPNFISPETNDVTFIAYGDRKTLARSVRAPWNTEQYISSLRSTCDKLLGFHTSIAHGFDKATELLKTYTTEHPNSHTKRVVIHIGDGSPTGYGSGSGYIVSNKAYEKMTRFADRVISVHVGRSEGHMKEWHTEDDDYINFRGTNYEDLKMNNMQFLMRQVCKQRSHEEMIDATGLQKNDK